MIYFQIFASKFKSSTTIKMQNKILSIQSKLVYGYVGANIAELIIQSHGYDIISFPTVYLAAHTQHKPIYGTVIEKDLFEDYIKGVKNLNIIPDIKNIITGYIGSVDVLESTAKFIKEIKELYPDRPYICDPVMGDVIGLYVPEEVAQALAGQLIPLADIITPNHFELEYIIGHKADTTEKILEGISNTPVLKDKTIIVTSCILKDSNDDQLKILLIRDNKAIKIPCKKVDIEVTGTGDFFTSLLASLLARGMELQEAIEKTSLAISTAMQYIVDKGFPELNTESILYALSEIRK